MIINFVISFVSVQSLLQLYAPHATNDGRFSGVYLDEILTNTSYIEEYSPNIWTLTVAGNHTPILRHLLNLYHMAEKILRSRRNVLVSASRSAQLEAAKLPPVCLPSTRRHYDALRRRGQDSRGSNLSPVDVENNKRR